MTIRLGNIYPQSVSHYTSTLQKYVDSNINENDVEAAVLVGEGPRTFVIVKEDFVLFLGIAPNIMEIRTLNMEEMQFSKFENVKDLTECLQGMVKGYKFVKKSIVAEAEIIKIRKLNFKVLNVGGYLFVLAYYLNADRSYNINLSFFVWRIEHCR